jgi:hypothetical protein
MSNDNGLYAENKLDYIYSKKDVTISKYSNSKLNVKMIQFLNTRHSSIFRTEFKMVIKIWSQAKSKDGNKIWSQTKSNDGNKIWRQAKFKYGNRIWSQARNLKPS